MRSFFIYIKEAVIKTINGQIGTMAPPTRTMTILDTSGLGPRR